MNLCIDKTLTCRDCEVLGTPVVSLAICMYIPITSHCSSWIACITHNLREREGEGEGRERERERERGRELTA